MNMLKRLLIALLSLAVVFGLVGLLLPSRVAVERSIAVTSPPPAVFAALNGFQQFAQWSPWADRADDIEYRFGGALHGTGARMEWHSADPDVGSGSQEIIESLPYQRIAIALSFDGFDAPSRSEFRLAPATNGGTELRWMFSADMGMNLIGRYFGLMMDRYIGADYERGLSRFKQWIESQPPAEAWSEAVVSYSNLPAAPTVALDTDIALGESAEALALAYSRLQSYAAAQGLRQVGAPLAINRQPAAAEGRWALTAALPVNFPCSSEAGDMPYCARSYGGPALKLTHTGGYESIRVAYGTLEAYRRYAGLQAEGNSWEQYISDPGNTAEGSPSTDVILPVR